MDTNLALGRPATQSSVSKYSKFPACEADASGANNGRIDGLSGFHTGHQANPWWQVDLQSTCNVRMVRLFNRQKFAYRLRHFSILASLDGISWTVLHRKTDDADFGADSLLPYIVALPPGSLARYVRIRLDGTECLHFCECEVFGTKADGETVAEIKRREFERQAALRDGRHGHVAVIGNFGVFVDTDKYSPAVIRTLDEGWYEARERDLVGKLLQAGDHVLEIGTALGAVTMSAAMVVGAKNVLTYEANPQIAADARRNFVFNDLGAVQARVGVLCNRLHFGSAPSEMEFSIARDFWSSRLHVGPITEDIVETVLVPTACLEDQIDTHRATVLICDIEGGEIELLVGADLSGIRLIIMEVHNWAVGVRATDNMMRWLVVNGFNIDLRLTAHEIVVLSR